MANKIQTIMRTAAMIYAEDQSIQTVKSVRRRFVDAVLVNSDNVPHTVEQIIISLQKDHEIVVQEKEIIGFLDDDAKKAGKVINGYTCLGEITKLFDISKKSSIIF